MFLEKKHLLKYCPCMTWQNVRCSDIYAACGAVSQRGVYWQRPHGADQGLRYRAHAGTAPEMSHSRWEEEGQRSGGSEREREREGRGAAKDVITFHLLLCAWCEGSRWKQMTYIFIETDSSSEASPDSEKTEWRMERHRRRGRRRRRKTERERLGRRCTLREGETGRLPVWQGRHEEVETQAHKRKRAKFRW